MSASGAQSCRRQCVQARRLFQGRKPSWQPPRGRAATRRRVPPSSGKAPRVTSRGAPQPAARLVGRPMAARSPGIARKSTQTDNVNFPFGNLRRLSTLYFVGTNWKRAVGFATSEERLIPGRGSTGQHPGPTFDFQG